jgi:hypothetical protein
MTQPGAPGGTTCFLLSPGTNTFREVSYITTTTQAGEQLLRQLTSAVSDLYFDVPLPKLHMTIAGILSMYDIRPAIN